MRASQRSMAPNASCTSELGTPELGRATASRQSCGSSACSSAVEAPPAALDLLRWPVLGTLLRRKWLRRSLQFVLLAVAALLVTHGLAGPSLAPKNLSTLLTWVHYRGLLVLVLLFAGNLFCMGCPLLLPRELARRFVAPSRSLPRALRNKWLATGLFVGVLFAYEYWDLWAAPAWTAALILGYFALALLVDSIFERAPFCKYVCPVGQFNFIGSTLSPLEVRVAEPDTCARCHTADCIRGSRDPGDPHKILQRGCELDLWLPAKVGNLDCTFCLDCVHACPHDNVALALRMPGDELSSNARRSGIGRLTERRDLSALVVVFAFGALLNAFGMVTPVYAFQQWLAEILGTRSEGVILALLFLLGLLALPLLLLATTGTASRRLARIETPLAQHCAHFAFSLAPLGFGVWAAHYAFHFLTGLWTFIPVAQSAAADIGLNLGAPQWGRGGWSAAAVQPVELGLLVLGLAGSIAVTLRIAQRDLAQRANQGATPWILLHTGLFATALWLLSQPMEMRGTFL